MAKYKVTGLYTISFDMEVEADSQEEAEEMAYKELCNMDGLDNDWCWSEYCSSMDMTGL